MAKHTYTNAGAQGVSGQDRIYQMITDRIVAAMEDAIASGGSLPWKRGWIGGAHANYERKQVYRGSNAFILAASGFKTPYWFTYKQLTARGGSVKGAHGYPVIFWKFLCVERDSDTDEKDEKRIPLLRYYTVFNYEQVAWPDGKAPQRPVDPMPTFTPVERAAQIVQGFQKPPAILHRGGEAWYKPAADTVQLPEPEKFQSPEAYYRTLFHELAHSTGHKSRLDRPELYKGLTESGVWGKGAHYAAEELTAEMTATFLAAQAGINTADEEQNSVAYLRGWLKALKDDPRLIVTAGGKAQKAADYILGIKWETETAEEA